MIKTAIHNLSNSGHCNDGNRSPLGQDFANFGDWLVFGSISYCDQCHGWFDRLRRCPSKHFIWLWGVHFYAWIFLKSEKKRVSIVLQSRPRWFNSTEARIQLVATSGRRLVDSFMLSCSKLNLLFRLQKIRFNNLETAHPSYRRYGRDRTGWE